MSEMDVSAYLARGIEYFENKNYNEAISDFTEAINLDSNCAEAYFYRGKAYWLTAGKKKDEDIAIANIKVAMALDPDNAEYYNNLKMVLDDVGYGYGITITGRTLNPDAELKKRLIAMIIVGVVFGLLVVIINAVHFNGSGPGDVIGIVIGSVIGFALGIVIFGVFFGIGVIPWLHHAKRNLLDIPNYFKNAFGAAKDAVEGNSFTGVIKSFFFALILTMLWKPIKLVLLIYVCPFIGIFQTIELLRERKKNKKV